MLISIKDIFLQTAVTMDSAMDQTLLAEMNAQQSIWGHYGFSRQDFVALSEPQKNTLIAKYYSDKIKSGFIDCGRLRQV